MINRNEQYTLLLNNKNEYQPIAGSTFLYAYTQEERSKLASDFIPKWDHMVLFVGVEYMEDDTIMVEGSKEKYPLRSIEALTQFVDTYATSVLYMDISGLNARISAALLPIMFRKGIDVHIIYAEPSTYQLDKFKKEGVLIDLAEKVEGIRPLPGFASIITDNLPRKFIPLLGFEGARFTQMLEAVAPDDEDIIPMVGLPGYRMEYPFVTLYSNKAPLVSTSSWENIVYVGANSIVDVYLQLLELTRHYPDTKMVVAPIGTKPHAIGAILFAMKHRDKVELVYDNPKRKERRTDGVGKIVVCHATKLVNEN